MLATARELNEKIDQVLQAYEGSEVASSFWHRKVVGAFGASYVLSAIEKVLKQVGSDLGLTFEMQDEERTKYNSCVNYQNWQCIWAIRGAAREICLTVVRAYNRNPNNIPFPPPQVARDYLDFAITTETEPAIEFSYASFVHNYSDPKACDRLKDFIKTKLTPVVSTTKG